MTTDNSQIEAALLYRSLPDLDAEQMVAAMNAIAKPGEAKMGLARTTPQGFFISDGTCVIGVETRRIPRMAQCFIGIGLGDPTCPDNQKIRQIIRDHSAHVLIRVASLSGNATSENEFFRYLKLCARATDIVLRAKEPLSVHWAQSRRFLFPADFASLAQSDNCLGLMINLQPHSEPIPAGDAEQWSYSVTGAALLIGAQLRLTPTTLSCIELQEPVLTFVKTCLERGALPPDGTTYKSATGMEFSVANTTRSQNDDTPTLELTPSVTPNKVKVERRRDAGDDKAASPLKPRRRTARQDERDLRHAYRGHETAKPRKIVPQEATGNTNARPQLRLVGNMTFLLAIGLAAALGFGVALYGADGLMEQVTTMWAGNQ